MEKKKKAPWEERVSLSTRQPKTKKRAKEKENITCNGFSASSGNRQKIAKKVERMDLWRWNGETEPPWENGNTRHFFVTICVIKKSHSGLILNKPRRFVLLRAAFERRVSAVAMVRNLLLDHLVLCHKSSHKGLDGIQESWRESEGVNSCNRLPRQSTPEKEKQIQQQPKHQEKRRNDSPFKS